jgi:hypothetical protein
MVVKREPAAICIIQKMLINISNLSRWEEVNQVSKINPNNNLAEVAAVGEVKVMPMEVEDQEEDTKTLNTVVAEEVTLKINNNNKTSK